MLRMLRKDRVLLRNVVIAVVCGSVGAMTIGAVCLGRDHSAPTQIITTTTDTGGDPVGTTRTTSAENDPSVGTVAPVGSTNISSTTVIVNPAAPASGNDNSGGTQQPIIIQQAAPASAPPADTGNQSQSTAAPAATISPESVQAQDALDAKREQESYQAAQGQGTQIIPVPVQNGGAMPPGTQVPVRDPNVPGANNPSSNYYPPGPSRPGQLGPNVPNGGASTFSASGTTAPQQGTFGGGAAATPGVRR